MACVAVTSLVRTLELEFLQPQPRPIVLENKLISGNKGLIQSLCEKLEFLMEQFDEKRMDGVGAVKHLETKLRDLAFGVEDEIELQVVHLYAETLQRDTDDDDDDDEKTHHCLRFSQPRVENIHYCLRLHHILQRAIEDIDQIQEELVKVKNDEVGVLTKYDEVIMMGDSFQNASHLEDIKVGKNGDIKTIMELLIEHPSKQREVVPINGMAGIGKTTLARRVYEDLSIATHFDKRAWTVSSQHHDKRQMLEGLLNLKGSEQSNTDTEELALRVYQGLKGQRYLVVMDDVWSKEAWDAVKACFPDDRNGSRVLLTTRLAEVANYTCSSSGFSHQVHMLDQSDSWNLFVEKACKTQCAEFETIGKPIVEKCQGLPLAIVVVAGLFSKLNTLNEWENIVVALNSSETTTIAEETCSRILSLSYNHLPYNMKACFLYFGLFPEDKEINTNSLARLWAAEGLIKTFENESFEVVAQRHIQDLVDRNLILVSKLSSCGRKVKTFQIHDVLHAFCLREAQNENLLNIVRENGFNSHHKDFRWVSIQSSSFDVRTLYTCSKKLRSILYFPKFEVPARHLNLQKFHLLRVLYSSDIKYVYEPKFCRNVYPIHLRYLSYSLVETFNPNPFNTWNLQTLCGRTYTHSLPTSLDFPQLRHYYCALFFRLDCPNFVHQNLQRCSGLSLSSCTKELFTNTPCLKKVGIVKISEGSVDCWIGNLACLQQLESLKISIGVIGGMFEYAINNQIALLKNLKKLSFNCTGFQWEEINILSMLPRLEVLKLGYLSCQGQSWRLRGAKF